MARLARVAVPEVPGHVTHQGNGRARTFFCDEDYTFYRDLFSRHCGEAAVEVRAQMCVNA
jgi:putative transposase